MQYAYQRNIQFDQNRCLDLLLMLDIMSPMASNKSFAAWQVITDKRKDPNDHRLSAIRLMCMQELTWRGNNFVQSRNAHSPHLRCLQVEVFGGHPLIRCKL